MGIYFAFSDESGAYKKEKGKKFLKKHPYFIRATYIIKGTEWKLLSQTYRNLKEKYRIPLNKELKWSYIWSLRSYQKNNKSIPTDKPFYFLKDIDYHELINFVEETLYLLNHHLSYAKIIITVTFNNSDLNFSDVEIYKMHLQDLMQRIEMELQSSEENLAVLFLDPISEEKDKLLREAYHSLYMEDDFIKRYSHIKDSLNFENSHQSVGIQLADYIAGCFSGFLKDFERSIKLFCETVAPLLRINPRNRDPFGYGIVEVPKNRSIRNILQKKYERCMKKYSK